MSEKFEVGKKYKSRHSVPIWDCVWVSQDYAVLAYNGRPGTFLSHDRRDFVEYVEPKIEKIVRHVRKSHFWDDGYTAAMSEKRDDLEYTGSIELTIVDGKLTDATVLKG